MMRAMNFQNRTVVLCVGGGIAAYKACELARLVVKGRGTVRVAMTPAATRFVRVPGLHFTQQTWRLDAASRTIGSAASPASRSWTDP